MRSLLSNRETAKILGKRINSLYKIINAFDANLDDEWPLIEGEQFELIGTPMASVNGKRAQHMGEQGIKAIARTIETTENRES